MSLCQNPQLFHSVWFQWGWAKCSWESQELTGKWEHWGRRLQGQGSLNRQGVGAWAPVILAFVHVKTGKFRCLYNKEPRYHRKRAIKKKKWLYHCFQTLALKKKKVVSMFSNISVKHKAHWPNSPGSGRASNQQRDLYSQPLHLLSNKNHLIQGGSDKPWQANYIYYFKKKKKKKRTVRRRIRAKEEKYENSFSKLCNKDPKTEYQFRTSNSETSFPTWSF